jgi:hypothetical protein
VQINTRRYHSTPSRIWNIQTVESLSTKTKWAVNQWEDMEEV